MLVTLSALLVEPYIDDLSSRIDWLGQALIAFLPYGLAGLLAGAVVLTLGAILGRFWLVEQLRPVEELCLLTLKELASPTRDRIVTAITYLAQGEVTIPLLIGIGGMLIYRGEDAAALILILGLCGSWLLNGVFKSFFRRQRPNLWESAKRPMDYSFPSGHSMSAISFYGLLAADLSAYFGVSLSITIPVVAAVTVGVGLSRLYLGIHWPTDVFSGWLAGGIWLWVCLLSLTGISGL
jgi:undecaprenyl-diphosphatase